MKFKMYGFQNDFTIQNGINVITINNINLYSKTVFEICNEDTQFHTFDLINEQNTIENFYKKTNVIFNPFVCNFNDKKIINAMYKEFNLLIIDDVKIHTDILNKINELSQIVKQINYDMDYDIEMSEDIIDLLKFLNLKIANKTNSVLDSIYNFLNVYSHFFPQTILVFFNLSQIVSMENLLEISKYAKYHNLIIISFEKNEIANKSFNQFIIDNDFYDYVVKN